jgi:hypothetical protein
MVYSPFNSTINLNVFVVHEQLENRCSIPVKNSDLYLRHCTQTVSLYALDTGRRGAIPVRKAAGA